VPENIEDAIEGTQDAINDAEKAKGAAPPPVEEGLSGASFAAEPVESLIPGDTTADPVASPAVNAGSGSSTPHGSPGKRKRD
jgi:hypothetical protein